MKIKKTKFKDLLIIKQKNNIDSRGSLRETFRCKSQKEIYFRVLHSIKVQCFEGFHIQTKYKQAKYVNVLKGKILDIVIDLRKILKLSVRFLQFVSKKCFRSLYTSRFRSRYYSMDKENIIYYKLDNYYAPKFESGIIYNDPVLKIKWPKKK